MRQSLVVMAKAPVAGAVKSRLAARIGVVEATRFYRTNLARIVRRLGTDPRWRLYLAVAPDTARDSAMLPPGAKRMAQGAGDLGARMQRVCDHIAPGPVVIIGSDIPRIDAGLVAEAFRSLGSRDAVFGPAEDGGYWLVGLRRRPRVPRLFDNVRWSSPEALADTLANTAGLSVGFLPTLEDVDEVESWRRWRRAQG